MGHAGVLHAGAHRDHGEPVGLALALGLLVVGFAGTNALPRRLAWNSAVKRCWGKTYETRAAAG